MLTCVVQGSGRLGIWHMQQAPAGGLAIGSQYDLPVVSPGYQHLRTPATAGALPVFAGATPMSAGSWASKSFTPSTVKRWVEAAGNAWSNHNALNVLMSPEFAVLNHYAVDKETVGSSQWSVSVGYWPAGLLRMGLVC